MDTLTKAAIEGCLYDPTASRFYDIMRGGFLWTDELDKDPGPETVH